MGWYSYNVRSHNLGSSAKLKMLCRFFFFCFRRFSFLVFYSQTSPGITHTSRSDKTMIEATWKPAAKLDNDAVTFM